MAARDIMTLAMMATLAGCASQEPVCATALAQLTTRISASVHTDLERDLAKRFGELSQERCTEDGWSRAVRTCVRDATSYADFDECEKSMTEAQEHALRQPNR